MRSSTERATDRFINRLGPDLVLQSWKWVWNFRSLVVCSSCCLWFCSLSWPIMVTMLLRHTDARAQQTPLPMSRKRYPRTMSAFITQVRALFSSISCCIWDIKRCSEIDVSSILNDHLKCFNDYSVTCLLTRLDGWWKRTISRREKILLNRLYEFPCRFLKSLYHNSSVSVRLWPEKKNLPGAKLGTAFNEHSGMAKPDENRFDLFVLFSPWRITSWFNSLRQFARDFLNMYRGIDKNSKYNTVIYGESEGPVLVLREEWNTR